MTNFSQGQEQPAILSALEGITGRILEIGAYHPTCMSNSRALIELGWEAVMIEPGPGQLKALITEYGNNEKITIIAAAVGMARGLAKLHATDDATSTTETAHFQKWNRVCAFYGSFMTPTITIADILWQFGSFDFVSIDAEGVSADIFRTLLATEMRPKCICVEYDSEGAELERLANQKGYNCVFKNGENLVLKLR